MSVSTYQRKGLALWQRSNSSEDWFSISTCSQRAWSYIWRAWHFNYPCPLGCCPLITDLHIQSLAFGGWPPCSCETHMQKVKNLLAFKLQIVFLFWRKSCSANVMSNENLHPQNNILCSQCYRFDSHLSLYVNCSKTESSIYSIIYLKGRRATLFTADAVICWTQSWGNTPSL